MNSYFVQWFIDLDAASPEDAARKALAIQRDPTSLATVFSVIEHDSDGTAVTVDLSDLDNGGDPDVG